jgi:protein AroM
MLQVLAIGQSPRPDLEAEIAAAVPGLRVALRGALDGMSRSDLAAIAPRGDGDTLFTVLPEGEAITVSKAEVTRRVRAALEAMRGPVLLACTGAFAGLPARPDLVQPSAVLNALAEALLPQGRLGLFVPLPEQAATLGAARRRDGLQVHAVALRPHGDDAAREAAAREMAGFAPDLLLLDCMAYTRQDKAALARSLSCPILLAISCAAHAVAALLPEH